MSFRLKMRYGISNKIRSQYSKSEPVLGLQGTGKISLGTELLMAGGVDGYLFDREVVRKAHSFYHFCMICDYGQFDFLNFAFWPVLKVKIFMFLYLIIKGALLLYSIHAIIHQIISVNNLIQWVIWFDSIDVELSGLTLFMLS